MLMARRRFNHYANKQYWLNRHARQKTFFLDVSDDEDDEITIVIYINRIVSWIQKV